MRAYSDLGNQTMTFVIAEHRSGVLNSVSWEVIAAAQQIGEPVTVAVAGHGMSSVADELAQADVVEVVMLDDLALEPYTSDGFVDAWTQVIKVENPELVILPHTYQTRDFAPKLAVRLGKRLITDCVATKRREEGLAFVRPMFQGKFVADIVPQEQGTHFASFQVGSFRADSVVRRDDPAPVRKAQLQIDPLTIRQRPETPFKEAKQAVDLGQAQRIVAVGRGIKEQDRLPLAQELAKVLDAELAASRPICDAGWLPMDRQIGSSGQTVSPKLYMALGISGAIQHLVGMKGSHTIVAVNKDADAPIFEVADYGIVGDLFEVVPAIISALGE
jgi:electron transfer flavoprotein alpha subunit